MKPTFKTIFISVFIIIPVLIAILGNTELPSISEKDTIENDSIFAYSLEEALAEPNPSKIIGLRLTGKIEFPSIVFSFTNLKKVIFDNCKFTILPAQISELKRLETIEFREMDHIPRGTSEIKHLNNLILTQLTNVEIPKELDESPELTTLLVRFCRQIDISNLPYIKTAVIHAVDSMTYANSICNWQILERLWLSEVNMPYLPNCLSRSKTLYELEIGFSNFKELSDQVLQINSLQRLRIYNTNLTDIPENIFSMNSLHTLILKNNQLPDIEWDSIIQASPIDTIEITQGKDHWKKP